MKEEYWNELNEIFLNDEELQKKHEKLFKIISLVVEDTKKTNELQKLHEELQKLNK